MASLGERIKQRRKELGISQGDLALAVGSNQTQIWRYESGDNDPTGKVIARLAQVLDVSSDWLLDLTELKGTGNVDEEERELLKLFHTKNSESRKKLIEIAKVV